MRSIKLKLTKSIIFVIIAIIGGVFINNKFLDKKQNTTNKKDVVTITKIVDGDTFGVIFQGKNEKIRLIGVDTPESRKNKKAFKDSKRSKEDVNKIVELGKRAKEFVKSLVKVGDNLKIEFDVRERDQYGRLLVYLYLKDGKMLNNFLIEEGYAAPLTYPPNVKYEDMFRNSYRAARENKKGLWAD